MSTNSSIEWTDTTWNPVVGCTPVSPGCLNCYAAAMSRRLEAMGKPAYVGLTVRRGPTGSDPDKFDPEKAAKATRTVFNGVVRTLPGKLGEPLTWRRPRRVFVNSMSDLFHEGVPFEFVDRVFAVMALTPHHTYQVLTKRPERMAEYLSTPGLAERVVRAAYEVSTGTPLMEGERVRKKVTLPLPNVWLGTSVENQACADERVPHLLRCPATVRFLSVEPQVGEVDLRLGDSEGVPTSAEPCRERGWLLHWVIQGGESGPGARPFDLAWARGLRDQCRAAGVAYFLKQLGAAPYWDDIGQRIELKLKNKKGGDEAEWPEDLRGCRAFPGEVGAGGRKGGG
jgi:protein gp37